MEIPFYYRTGIRVRTKDSLKHHGGKEGTIVSRNVETNHVEYGVAFHSKRHIDAWFLMSELEPIIEIPLELDVDFG